MNIQKLYVAYYGRPADPAGLLFWEDALQDNPVDLVLEAFGTSREYLKISTDDPIATLYQQMFNREPEAEGLEFYAQKLANGEASLASIALDIANGAQGQDAVTLSNKICVANTVTKALMEETVIDSAPYYSSSSLEDARFLLASVGSSQESLTEGKENAQDFVYSLPYIVSGGECIDDEGEVFVCPQGSIYEEYAFECPIEPTYETDYLL